MEDKIINLKDLIDNNTSVNFPNQVVTIYFDALGVSAHFNDKIFICEKLIFENIHNSEYQFKFYDCTFNCEVEFNNCNFDELSFKNINAIKSLTLKGKDEDNKAKLNSFRFYNEETIHNDKNPKPQLSTDFYISNLVISETLLIENIDHIGGKFEVIGNELSKGKNEFIRFKNSCFYNAYFYKNDFKSKTSFNNTIFKYDSEHLKTIKADYTHTKFYENTFEKVDFSKSTFDKLIEFDNCDFLSTTWFEKCKSLTNSHLKFVSCEFKGFSLFNKSKINFLDIDRCTFNKSSSFTDTEFNTLKLFEVKFGGGAYFDEMKINNVLDKSYLKDDDEIILEWKRTLRAIKQESQKIENKIDFNNYRNYELAAHYKE